MHHFFQGAFADAIAHLQNFSSTIKENMQLRSNLQMACCFYCLQKYSVRRSSHVQYINKSKFGHCKTVYGHIPWGFKWWFLFFFGTRKPVSWFWMSSKTCHTRMTDRQPQILLRHPELRGDNSGLPSVQNQRSFHTAYSYFWLLSRSQLWLSFICQAIIKFSLSFIFKTFVVNGVS